MHVICELEIGNDQEYPGLKVTLEGNPLKKTGFVKIRIGEYDCDVRPADLAAALQRVRSDS